MSNLDKLRQRIAKMLKPTSDELGELLVEYYTVNKDRLTFEECCRIVESLLHDVLSSRFDMAVTNAGVKLYLRGSDNSVTDCR